MADQQKKKLTPVQQQYQELAKQHEPKRPIFSNCLRAFLVGGLICAIGQVLMMYFTDRLGMPEAKASSVTIASLIFLSILLTSLGIYDKIGQWAGAGSAVPITGFANSMSSSAIEHRSEGVVLGISGKMFELAGSVIVFGAVSAVVVALMHLLFNPTITMTGG